MFKKKAKKEATVLKLDEAQDNPPPKEEPTPTVITGQVASSNNERQSDNQDHQSGKVEAHGVKQTAQSAPEGSKGEELAPEGKRDRQAEVEYLADSGMELGNQPTKKVKEAGGLLRARGIIGSSTSDRKEQLDRNVHEAFSGISHKAGVSLIKDMGLQEDEMQQEVARKRFLQNVEATRLVKEGKRSSKIYRGMNAYANHQMSKVDMENAETNYEKKMGPSRQNSAVKNTCRFDYVQNLCKDWHDSGYCPFGNSCLYLHDRSNVKTGWELEKEFEQAERERWKRINNPEIAHKEQKEKMVKSLERYKPPEMCEKCSREFRSPVEVECGHIFCEGCAIQMVRCATCSRRLGGIMNSAKEKLQRQGQTYRDMLGRLEAEEEDRQVRRRRFEGVDDLGVFNE